MVRQPRYFSIHLDFAPPYGISGENRTGVLLNTSLSHIDNVCTAAKFAYRPFCFAMSMQCHQNLLKKLNAAIRDIDREIPIAALHSRRNFFSAQR